SFGNASRQSVGDGEAGERNLRRVRAARIRAVAPDVDGSDSADRGGRRADLNGWLGGTVHGDFAPHLVACGFERTGSARAANGGREQARDGQDIDRDERLRQARTD